MRIVCDAHKGMLQAVEERWPQAELHQCDWHMQHALERLLRKELRRNPSEELRELQARTKGALVGPSLWRQFVRVARMAGNESLDHWIAVNGPVIEAQFARRMPASRCPVDMPLTTAALEQCIWPNRSDTGTVDDCPFCTRIADSAELLATSRMAVVFADAFPVSRGHVLVVPRRHLARLEELDEGEWNDVFSLVRGVAREIAGRADVDGVNLGVNSGVAAGQTVEHAHVHVIPRRHGDVDDPRGGVRRVIPNRAAYWSDR
jgi:diadenosine tetraphosphate (Ap4A) HIT family hydrolase